MASYDELLVSIHRLCNEVKTLPRKSERYGAIDALKFYTATLIEQEEKRD